MNEDTDSFGDSFSIICRASKARIDHLNTIPFRSGIYPTTVKKSIVNANPRTQLYG